MLYQIDNFMAPWFDENKITGDNIFTIGDTPLTANDFLPSLDREFQLNVVSMNPNFVTTTSVVGNTRITQKGTWEVNAIATFNVLYSRGIIASYVNARGETAMDVLGGLSKSELMNAFNGPLSQYFSIPLLDWCEEHQISGVSDMTVFNLVDYVL